ncbi:MAG TPA: hypothetical protein DEO73_17080 [Pantoea sp.]|nr:hypothetical protein [Pantoea sp.]
MDNSVQNSFTDEGKRRQQHAGTLWITSKIAAADNQHYRCEQGVQNCQKKTVSHAIKKDLQQF